MAWLVTVLGFVALIVLHELGHFAVAKAVGMRVERFSLFFPPTLVSRRRGETEYAIGAIPAGGYVRITGMTWEETRDMDLRIAHRAYCLQEPWRRAATILAGPAVNLVIAFVLFWLVLFSGDFHGAVALGNLDTSQRTLQVTNRIAHVDRREPAHGVLQPGDRIVTVDGRVATAAQASGAIAAHRCAGAPFEGCRASTPVQLGIRRDGLPMNVTVYPRYSAEDKRMRVGFEFALSVKPIGLFASAGGAASAMWNVTAETVSGLANALTSQKKRGELHSVVGIAQADHEYAQAGAGYELVFLGFLSLVLAVINLFPFLPLDGGHVLWSVAEKVRGRRISLLAMYRFSSVGIVLMLFLFVNGLGNDIGRLT